MLWNRFSTGTNLSSFIITSHIFSYKFILLFQLNRFFFEKKKQTHGAEIISKSIKCIYIFFESFFCVLQPIFISNFQKSFSFVGENYNTVFVRL